MWTPGSAELQIHFRQKEMLQALIATTAVMSVDLTIGELMRLSGETSPALNAVMKTQSDYFRNMIEERRQFRGSGSATSTN
jgi:hypothetical protein